MKKIKEFINIHKALVIGVACAVVTGVVGIILTQKVLEESKAIECEGQTILNTLKESQSSAE